MKKHLLRFTLLTGLSLFAAAPLRALDISFNNISGVDASQIWIQFQGVSGNQVSYGGNFLTFDPGTSFLTEGISLQDLTTNYGGKFNVDSLNGSFVVSMGTSALPLTPGAPGFIGGAALPNPFQKIELTHSSGNSSSGGDAEAINYFSIPLGINSYSGSGAGKTLAQSKQWNQSTSQVVSSIQNITGFNSTFYNTVNPNGTGAIVRYLGPTSYPPPPGGPALPYPSWNNYLTQVHNDNQSTTLVNSSGFNVKDGAIVSGASEGSINYNFAFNFTMTVDASNNIILTGSITATNTPFGQAPSAPTVFNNITITMDNNASDFTYAIYGSIFPTGSGTTFAGDGWTEFVNYVNSIAGLNPPLTGAQAVVTNQIAGELSSGFIMGFVNSDWVPEGGGDAVKDLPSNEWWQNFVNSSTLQPDNPFYNQWSALIAAASDNEIYSNPYSDRFEAPENPSIASLTYVDPESGSVSITEWEITIGEPVAAVPEPSTYALLLAAGTLLWFARKKLQA